MFLLEREQASPRVTGTHRRKPSQRLPQTVLVLFGEAGPSAAIPGNELGRLRATKAVWDSRVVVGRLTEARPDVGPWPFCLAELPRAGDLTLGVGIDPVVLPALVGERAPASLAERASRCRRVIDPVEDRAGRIRAEEAIEEVGVDELRPQTRHREIRELTDAHARAPDSSPRRRQTLRPRPFSLFVKKPLIVQSLPLGWLNH